MHEQATAKPVFTREALERLHAPAPPPNQRLPG